MFPAGPTRGEGTMPRHINPSSFSAKALIVATTSSCMAASRTTPPLPTCSRPASNWGLIKATMSPPGMRTVAIGGRISVREMKETSVTAMSGR